MFKADDSSPTSNLPFAALRGDVKHLDWIKNYRSEDWVEKFVSNYCHHSVPIQDSII